MKKYYLNEEGNCQEYEETQNLETCNPNLGGLTGGQFSNEVIKNAENFIVGSGLIGSLAILTGIKILRRKK